MIRILHTESSLGWGGQEMRILRELRGLDRTDFSAFLACQPGSRIRQVAAGEGFEVEPLRIRGNIDPLAVWGFMRLFRRKKVDIVHTHSNADSWNASLAAKLSRNRPRVVRTRHLSATFNTRFIYSFMADRVVTTGEYTRAYMVREKGIEPGRVAAIPSGIDLERFDGDRIREDLRGELGIAADTPVFGSTSVFRKKKGYHILLEAVPKIIEVFPTAKLLLVGGGPQENNLRRQIDDLRLGGNVILPGFREDMPRVLNTMDVYVFPTLEEAFPNAVMEAMAMRRPVVASRVGGVPDLIRDGETGYLVAPGDPAAIAERTCSLLLSAERRRELGAKGQRFVRENCSHRLMVRRLEDLYRAIMRERAS